MYRGKPLFCNYVLPWRASRLGSLAREAKRQLSSLLPDLTPGALRLCARSNTIFLKRAVAVYADEKTLALAAGPAWPSTLDWATFVATVEGQAHG